MPTTTSIPQPVQDALSALDQANSDAKAALLAASTADATAITAQHDATIADSASVAAKALVQSKLAAAIAALNQAYGGS
jgi:hypothetical protein